MKPIAMMTAFFLLLFSGCRTATKKLPEDGKALFAEEAVRQARTLIAQGRAECVLVKEGRIVQIERGRGVSPLLTMYDRHGEAMAGAVVVDKVIGRAAASVAILGGAKAVYGEVMSEDAAAWLDREGIVSGWGTLVPRILNRKRDGLCPLERSVVGCDKAPEAVAALRRKAAELAGNPMNNPKTGDR